MAKDIRAFIEQDSCPGREAGARVESPAGRTTIAAIASATEAALVGPETRRARPHERF
jgi:hypothetical protein